MKENMKKCPICPRGCELTAPHCRRGEDYAKTGKMTENGVDVPRSGRLQFEHRNQQLVMKYLHHAAGIAGRGGFTQEMTGELFSVFTEEETDVLAALLQKLSGHWMNIVPEKPVHPGSRHCRH